MRVAVNPAEAGFESYSGSQNFKGDLIGSPLKFLLPCAGENLCELVQSEAKEVLPGPF